jgi:hypothetical protein
VARKPLPARFADRPRLPSVQQPARTAVVAKDPAPRVVLDARCADGRAFWMIFRHNQVVDRFYFQEVSTAEKPAIKSVPYRLNQILIETATCPYCRSRLERSCIFTGRAVLTCSGTATRTCPGICTGCP